ncbi:ABC transporter ATP-binding protein [Lysinibacillus sp. NPDC093210]|uniref:ABC transporter ATP-binding protein n=1 Tax=Lysinibacillus sp. NPDC093210 TaxID=3364133 RepID=UPI0037F97FC6
MVHKQKYRCEDNQNYLKSAGETFILLLNMVWKSGPLLTLCIVIFIVVDAIIPIIQLYFSKKIIDGIVEPNELSHTELWAIAYAVSLLILSIVKSLESWVKTLLAERSMITVNSFLLDAFDRIPGMRFFEDRQYRDRLETLRDHATWLPFQLISISANFITAILSSIGIILVIVYFSPVLALLLILSTGPFAIVQNRYNEMEWEYAKEYALLRRKMDYTRSLLLGRRSAKEVRLFGLGNFFKNMYISTFEHLYSVFSRIQIKGSYSTVLTSFLSGVGTGIGYFWILMKTGSGIISIGDFALYLGAVFQLSVAMRDIAKEGADTIDLWRMGKDFILFMKAEKDIELSSKPVPIASEGALSIEFRDVCFRYPYQESAQVDGHYHPSVEDLEETEDEDFYDEPVWDDNLKEYEYEKNIQKNILDTDKESFKVEKNSGYVLDHINFSVSPGEKVAIVGANGSGKTTLIKLLCRFYEFNQGEIKVNGIDIRNLDLDELRKQISVVFQEFGRYEMSIRENIALGDLNALHNEDKIKYAVHSAKLETTIAELTENLDTMVGPEWGGIDFSGGQWQRIALARALMRQAGLVILDEPSAALDIRAEYDIFQQFKKLTHEKTVIMISHRFSTVRMADRILVLKNGKIVEEGSHENLLKKNGEYAKMFRLQAKSFQGKDESLC